MTCLRHRRQPLPWMHHKQMTTCLVPEVRRKQVMICLASRMSHNQTMTCLDPRVSHKQMMTCLEPQVAWILYSLSKTQPPQMRQIRCFLLRTCKWQARRVLYFPLMMLHLHSQVLIHSLRTQCNQQERIACNSLRMRCKGQMKRSVRPLGNQAVPHLVAAVPRQPEVTSNSCHRLPRRPLQHKHPLAPQPCLAPKAPKPPEQKMRCKASLMSAASPIPTWHQRAPPWRQSPRSCKRLGKNLRKQDRH
mmetsp:Transcript_117134/g.203930  ORF Transcript_117134/g.203930 Transcript_117134/m.203930 type:complete len:247 (+) Transcript_117134:501-1241(+)